MPAVSVERIRDWIFNHRTPSDYAFTSIDVALGIGGPPPEVALLCGNAVHAGMLACVTVGEQTYYTHPTVGFADKITPKRLKTLEELGKIRRVKDAYEWTMPHA